MIRLTAPRASTVPGTAAARRPGRVPGAAAAEAGCGGAAAIREVHGRQFQMPVMSAAVAAL